MNGVDLGMGEVYQGVDISTSTPQIGDSYDAAPSIIDQSFTLLPTDGQRYIDSRANTENPAGNFLGFDQSKITGGIYDVLASASKSVGIAAQQTVSGILSGGVAGAKQGGQTWLNRFMMNFTSTKTGAQVQASAQAEYLRRLFQNPLTWIVALTLGYFLMLGMMRTAKA